MRRPTVSIVTPCLDSAATIAQTIRSIASQSYPVEHVVCDGCSGDGTTAVVRRLAPGAKICSEPDDGLYHAINRGIALCSGEIIGILNADDFYCHGEAIACVVAAFEAHPEADIVYGGIQFVDARRTERITRRWRPSQAPRSAWRQGWMPPHPAFFVRAEVYAELGGYNTDLSMSSDYEFMLRAIYFAGRKAVCVDELLVNMRTGGMSNVTIANRLKANRQDRVAWRLNDARPPVALALLKPLRKLHQWRWRTR